MDEFQKKALKEVLIGVSVTVGVCVLAVIFHYFFGRNGVTALVVLIFISFLAWIVWVLRVEDLRHDAKQAELRDAWKTRN